MKILKWAMALAAITTSAPAFAMTLMFDDLPSGTAIRNGYGRSDFVWLNAHILSASSAAARYGMDNGFVTGVVSPDNLMYNGFGDTGALVSSTRKPFWLVSAEMTAVTSDKMIVNFQSVDIFGNLFTKDVSLNTLGPTHIDFNWQNTVYVSYYSPGSLLDVKPGISPGNMFTFDNLTFSEPVPEPATWLTMILGFGMIGAGMRRRQKVATKFNFA